MLWPSSPSLLQPSVRRIASGLSRNSLTAHVEAFSLGKRITEQYTLQALTILPEIANNIKLFFLKSFADFRPQQVRKLGHISSSLYPFLMLRQGLYYGELISFALGDFYIAISLCCLLYSKRKAFDRTWVPPSPSCPDLTCLTYVRQVHAAYVFDAQYFDHLHDRDRLAHEVH